MSSTTPIKHLWYTRRGSEVRGPFPQGLITRYILLGRILMEDELSSDQIRWLRVTDVPDVIPEEMKGDPNDPEMQKRILIARRREDEREAGDRRHRQAEKIAQEILERRRKDDRRAEEEAAMLQHRNLKTNLIKERKTQHEAPRVSLLLGIAVLVVGVVIAGFLFMPKPRALKLQCDAPAGPQVNWSNCKFEGIVLNDTNLSGARLNNANLSGAQLQRTALTGADLSYANLGNADLTGVNASSARMTGTTLRNAILAQANLTNARLGYAILQGADLRGASLRGADLERADLGGANIDGADFSGAQLSGAIWIDREVCGDSSIGACVKQKK